MKKAHIQLSGVVTDDSSPESIWAAPFKGEVCEHRCSTLCLIRHKNQLECKVLVINQSLTIFPAQASLSTTLKVHNAYRSKNNRYTSRNKKSHSSIFTGSSAADKNLNNRDKSKQSYFIFILNQNHFKYLNNVSWQLCIKQYTDIYFNLNMW